MARQADHHRAADLISAYLDQQVTAEEQQFFERHLAACAECRAQLEATRSMVAALRAMPVVKAPRSFVLPREMAKQPKRSIFAWYPALRLATALAAIAFVVLFAGDLLISRSGGSNVALMVPAAAPAPQQEQMPMAMEVPAATVIAQSVPTEDPAARNYAVVVSPTLAAADMAATGAADAALPPAAAGATSPKAVVTDVVATDTFTAAEAMSATMALPEVTALPEVAMAPSPTPAATPEPAPASSAAEQPGTAAAAAPAIDPLRVLELVLLGLVIVLGAAMLIARRKQV